MWTLEDENSNYLITIGVTFILFQWIYHIGAPKILNVLMTKEMASMSKRKQNITYSGICSVANSFVMGTASLYFLLTHNLHKNICWSDDFYVRLLSCFEIGAYFSDTLVLLSGNNEQRITPYICHHVVILFGSYISIAYGVFAYFLCLRGINEFSVPFQHARQIFYDVGWKDTRLYITNGLCFMVTFFFSRICIIPITIYSIYSIVGTPELARVNLFCKVVFLGGAVTIDTLNIYWFSLITRGAYKLLLKKKHP